MSKQNAYGSSTNDTAFRKTWDKEEYTAKAAAREASEKAEAKARYEAKLAGKKYYTPIAEDARTTESRKARLDVAANVGKVTLVPAGAGVGKRGKSAGFYCADCDLTFKDNLQWVEHLNSKGHLAKVGESGEVKRATLEEVMERFDDLVRKRDLLRKEAEGADLKGRIDEVTEKERRKREEKREQRRKKRRMNGGGGGDAVKQDEGKDEYIKKELLDDGFAQEYEEEEEDDWKGGIIC